MFIAHRRHVRVVPRGRPLAVIAVVAAAALPLWPAATVAAAARSAAARSAAASSGTGAYVLTATSTGGRYAPTFTGNGYIGLRVPPAGQGYAGGSVPTSFTLAGFYAQESGQVQQRANLPAWSGLAFSDGGQAFSLAAGRLSGWRQQLDLRDGVIMTSATWTAPDGHVTGLRYTVFTDRARPGSGVVRLTLTPHWSGTAAVTDTIDGTPATLTTGVAKGTDAGRRQDWVTIRAKGTGLIAGLASQLSLGPVGPGAKQATGRVGGAVGRAR